MFERDVVFFYMYSLFKVYVTFDEPSTLKCLTHFHNRFVFISS
jgi:hypothetical protein